MRIALMASVTLLLLLLSGAANCQAKLRAQREHNSSSLATPTPSISTTNDVFNSSVLKRTATTRAALEKVSYPKKVTSLKKRPTKTPGVTTLSSALTLATSPALPTKSKKAGGRRRGDVTSAFKNLPDDDLAFIKELDKQFQLHGDRVKIKVERETNTNGTKNTKRGIDGELGYGYNEHSGYDYARPKYSFYPYSQHDIAPDAPGYYPPKTSVDIQPSYSYELKPQTTYEQQQQQHQEQYDGQQHQIDLPSGAPEHAQQAHQQHYDEPVIVLRIPGPAKYASHLQALLQQYLEIRAAQYLQILEAAELRKQQEEQQQQQQQHHAHSHPQHQHQQLQYDTAAYHAAQDEEQQPQHQAQQHQQQQEYNAEVAYAHQMAPTPQPVLYPDIHDVYQSYKGRHGMAQQHAAAPEYYADVQTYQTTAAEHQQHQQQPQEVEAPQAQHPQQVYFTHHEQVPEDHIYQQYYLISMTPDGQTYAEPQPQSHELEQPQHADDQQQQHHHHQQIYRADDGDEGHAAPAISENSPRTTHTKVLFTAEAQQQQPQQQHSGAEQLSGAYTLPSIRPYDRLAPTSTPHYHQEYQQQHAVASQEYQQEASQTHAVGATAAPADDNVVAITQRPFNYHAHGQGRVRGRKRTATHSKRSEDGGSRSSTTSTPKRGGAAPTHKSDEQQLQKIREYVRENFGARVGKSVEYQTRQVLEA